MFNKYLELFFAACLCSVYMLFSMRLDVNI
jgi:hypothetical protein